MVIPKILDSDIKIVSKSFGMSCIDLEGWVKSLSIQSLTELTNDAERLLGGGGPDLAVRAFSKHIAEYKQLQETQP